MKLKNGFMLRNVSDAFVVIPTGECTAMTAGVITLNESGALLWKTLEKGCDGKDALIEALLAEYDVSREIASRDVDAFVAKLETADILSE